MSEYVAACLKLPLFEIPPPFLGKSQRLRQRVNTRRLVLVTANAALTSLNHLSTSLNSTPTVPNVWNDFMSCGSRRRGGVPCSFPASSNTAMYIPAVFSSHPPTFNAAQVQRTVQFVHAASKVFVHRARSGGGDECVSKHTVSYSDSSALAVPLIADKVALPEAAGVVQLLDLLPPELARKFAAPSPEMVVNAEPTIRVPGTILASSSEYRKLIIRMMKAGMISFTTDPKCVNGLFCVPKDGDSLRLIINAQPANTLFPRPPSAELPTPDLISNLVLDRAAEMYVAKVDISNYYHQLALPEWMWPYFALPALSATDLGLSQFGSDLVYPCCMTLPMGFSWSVFLAQQAHEHMIYTGTSILRSDAITRSSDSLVDRVRHSIYIDDLGIFGTDQDECRRMQLEYMECCKRWRLPVKMSKVVEPSSHGVEVLGVLVDGQQLTVGVAPHKLANLITNTLSVLHSNEATGTAIERLVGHWSWAFLVRRPAFSAFSAVYRFIAVADRRKFTMWDSVRNELLVACGLAPLLCTSLSARLLPRLIACDASSSGQGVVAAKVPQSVVESVSDLLSTAPHSSMLASTAGLTWQPQVDPGDQDPAMPAALLQDITENMLVRPRALPNHTVPPKVARLLLSQRWSTIVASPWTSHEHINVKEMRAASTTIRWVASLPSAFSSRVLVLSDSAVAAAVLTKGRSSAYNILRVSRFTSSLLLATNIQLFMRWVPSKWNPADAASRSFD